MEIKKMEKIQVESFHYDNQEELKPHQQIDFSLIPVYHVDENGQKETAQNGEYMRVSLKFDIAPEPGALAFSGEIGQVLLLEGYHGDGSDLSDEDYDLMSQPLMEEMGTLIYQITQITLPKPLNLQFGLNIKH
ncbi:MAG: DUF1149 family protein [Lactobacillus sp.]